MVLQTVKQPLVSVLMPAYKVEAYIAEAIESILAQTYPHWELIIVDDASPDRTQTVINTYLGRDARIRSYPNPKNLGHIGTYDKLLGLAQGDFITCLDADDYCPPERLALQLAAFEQNPALGMVGTACELVTIDKKHIRNHPKPCTYPEILATLPAQNPFVAATLMVSRAAHNWAGLCKPFFQTAGYSCQDYDRAYRIAEKFETINLPQPLYAYRQQPNSVSKTISLKYYLSDKIVQFLGKQRAETGTDALLSGQLQPLNDYIRELSQPFESNPSLIYHKYAEGFMYQRLYKKAIQTAWQAVKSNPWSLRNYRLLFYCMRNGGWGDWGWGLGVGE